MGRVRVIRLRLHADSVRRGSDNRLGMRTLGHSGRLPEHSRQRARMV
ncbi:hypothetical protein T261_02366 [Streptomyces lydicus]|nr:hypothetical protein T261_02366 [Streptomyces lydicus]